MRSHEGDPRDLARTDRAADPPGGRASRLAEAGKQLAIALEDVDLDEEPDLGRALTEAVVAVDRAFGHAGGGSTEEATSPGRDVPIVATGRPANADEDDRTRETRRGHERRRIAQASDPLADEEVEAGGLQFAGEPTAE